MEASRSYYQKQKEYDPYRELWVSLVKKASQDPNLSTLSRSESLYFSVGILEGEVYNGGFCQFFWNSSGNYYNLAVEGLQEIGAINALNITIKVARTLFGRSGPPADQEKRWRIFRSKTYRVMELLTGHRKWSQLDSLDKQFWADPDGLDDRLATYAEHHGLITPFLKDGMAI